MHANNRVCIRILLFLNIIFKQKSCFLPCPTHNKSQIDFSNDHYSSGNVYGVDSASNSLCYNNDGSLTSSKRITHYEFQSLLKEKGGVTKRRKHGVWSQKTLTTVSDLTSHSITDKSRCGEEEHVRWCIYVKHFPNFTALYLWVLSILKMFSSPV